MGIILFPGAVGATTVIAPLGQSAMADSVAVVVASDQSAVPVTTTGESGALTDRSGTITSGGTAQEVMAANAARRYLFIENLDSAEEMWINLGVTAVALQPSIRIQPLGSFVMEGSLISDQLVSVIAATTGHEFAAKEG